MKSIKFILILLFVLPLHTKMKGQESEAAQAYRDQDYKKVLNYMRGLLHRLSMKTKSRRSFISIWATPILETINPARLS